MNKEIFKNNRNLLITILVIVIAILIWGVIGADQASAIGKTCDIGINKSLCWKWHTNSVGQIGNAVNDFLNN